MDYITVGNYLKEFRKNWGYTQQEFADILGKSKSTIQKYEKGQIEIPDRVFRKISDLFGFYIPDKVKYLNDGIQENETFIQLQSQLLDYFSQLNLQGQAKAVEQVELVTKVPEYRADQDQEDKEKRPHT